MTPTGAGDAADAAFDTRPRTGLHARHGAAASAPVPRGSVRPARDRRRAGRPAAPALFRPRGAEGGNPFLGLAIAAAFSGLFWAAAAMAVRALWG